MAQHKNHPPEPASFRMCKLHVDSLAAHPEIAPALIQWMKNKAASPLALVGKDTPFVAKGPIGTLGLNIRHAHLTQDLAVCYRIHGRPTLIDLYGVFSHKELGTGDAANIRMQQQMAKRFGNQEFK